MVADLIKPDYSSSKIINGDINLDKGLNLLDKEINPELKIAGLYRIIYRFIYGESVVVQGSIFFDVGEEVRIKLYLDKKEYIQDENVKLTTCVFSSSALKGDLTLFMDEKNAKSENVEVDGYSEFNFAIKT